ncbi:probable nicotianamine synthase 6 [Hordeum vulgare subsp. vulgare]|uniref:Nicotianamine synthase n=1 Tax=Hordeum vulgare subsp. vulgare TaxID=112509 RepID=A0A8I7B798_HORVV|nr:probable nicotianamine synthase 6 [Hordeum vulgare subsp. vulgare]
MDAQNKEVDALVQKITSLHTAIAKLSSLSPSPDVDALFTDLVTACIPPSSMDVTKLGPEVQEMREGIIRLCSEAEGKLEAHYSDMLAAFDNPLDHLGMFPYYSNYINLSKLECELQARYVPGGIAPARVAFIGSGPLSFSSYVLAARRLPDAMFDNYDLCGAANDRASKLFRTDKDVGARMSFHTADVADLTGELTAYYIVFLGALVGMAADDKAKVITHLGAHMTDGAALVVRSAHGACGFLYPIVDPHDIGRGGFEVLVVYHPDDDVVNSVIIAHKSKDVHANECHNGRGGRCARGAVPVVSPPCRFDEMVADVTHKREEFANAKVAF